MGDYLEYKKNPGFKKVVDREDPEMAQEFVYYGKTGLAREYHKDILQRAREEKKREKDAKDRRVEQEITHRPKDKGKHRAKERTARLDKAQRDSGRPEKHSSREDRRRSHKKKARRRRGGESGSHS